tara:strand:+ start:457 stop:993 length:537 start_codon:yes stop_codon:yes gene_type:complete
MKILILFFACCFAKYKPDKEGIVNCDGILDPKCGTYGSCRPTLSSPSNYTCICDHWYWTSIDGAEFNLACDHKRPSFITAVILTITLGYLGVGSFFLEWYTLGSVCYMILVGHCLIICISERYCSRITDATGEIVLYSRKDHEHVCAKFLLSICMITIYILQLSLIISGCNLNGVPCN